MYIQSINIFNKYSYTQVVNFLKQLNCLTDVRAVVSVNDTCYQKVKLKSILPKNFLSLLLIALEKVCL